MKTRIYHANIDCAACAEKVASYLSSVKGISSASFDFINHKLKVVSDLPSDEIVKEAMKADDALTIEDSDRKLTLDAKIDCAACASKVEGALLENSEIYECSFDFAKGKLHVTTPLSEEEVKALAKKADDDITFPSKSKHLVMKVKPDCPNCAARIEAELKKHPDISSCTLDFTTSKLTLETTLPPEEIKKIIIKIDDETTFPEEGRKVTLKAKADCADCARKVEEALKKNPEISDCSFDFTQGKLTLTTTLSIPEIKKLVLEADDDIVLSDEVKSIKLRVKTLSKENYKKLDDLLSGNENIKKFSINKEKGKIVVETSLTEEEVKNLILKGNKNIIFLSKRDINKNLIRIITSIALMLIAAVAEKFFDPARYLFLVAYLISGYDVLLKAIKNIFKGRVFDENFLMSIATVGAVILSSYSEAAAVMVFYQVGEYFQDRAVRKSRASITQLMDIKSESATVIRNGEHLEVAPEEVNKGEMILVKAGEKIPLDGIVIEGNSYLDTRALTGESVPVSVKVGDRALSGSLNQDGVLTIQVTDEYRDSTVSRILALVEDSSEKKSSSEKFITKFSRYYTPIVVVLALLVAILPPLFNLGSYSVWVYRALMLLVVSCPCALVLSVPLSYFASIGAFAKQGILVKGADSVQNLAKTYLVAFDKTGTLTKGEFEVELINNYTDVDILPIAAALEESSTHPIAKAIVRKAGTVALKAEDIHEIAGKGIEGVIDGIKYLAGNAKLFSNAEKVDGTVVYIGREDKILGYITIADSLKSTTREAIKSLKENGVKKTAMLTGDKKDTADRIGKELGLDIVKSELLPDEKIKAFEGMMKEGTISAYVGDGINDAPTLSRADVGIAMGGVGSDAAIEAADCVIMTDDLLKISTGIKIAKKTEKIVKENIIFALSVKIVVIILSTLGITNMWLAIFADVGVSIIAVLNAMRCLSFREKK